ncbi:MAG: DUF1398 family protein [Candidatus Pseudobacter hemicellulosilyticus]|uniref:DUF1398 family protein n=1 Tax=Candidatus Pseudobacter hemicellulosilyticus TaxID=3121375 RepID=A0AAJ5WV53_9BACT|nr:MAG: DUF1398 family protein [Pseudobacter sp.]
MFTIEQIRQAHSKVQSGADFPAYITDLKALGITGYETWVKDGHTDYAGVDDQHAVSPAKYADLQVADNSDKALFKQHLQLHQQGHTDYPTFCRHCAEAGIEKWMVSIDQLTCTYYDKQGNQLLQEQIPQ